MKTHLSGLQAMKHYSNHCHADHGLAAVRQRLVVFAESAILAEPAESTFHDPAPRQDDEPLAVGRTFHNIEYPTAAPCGPVHERSRLSAIGPDPFQTGKPTPQLLKHEFRPVTVLPFGAMDNDGKQQAQRVNDDRTLTTHYFLARIITVRPPFCGAAVLTDWLSNTAAEGELSRPASTRTFSRRAS